MFFLLIVLFSPVMGTVNRKLEDKCYEKKLRMKICDFELSAGSLAQFTLTPRHGVTEETCLNLFETFDWDVGVFCPSLNFCGLGFDLDLDYRHLWDRQSFSPANHSCVLIGNTDLHTCDDLSEEFRSVGLFSSKYPL